MGELFNVPTLPNNFLPRPEDLATLKDAVLGQSEQAIAVTGKTVGGGRNVSLQGMGGIGKSVLATALVRDEDVRQVYPDGLFWVSLGQTPNLVALQINLATDLGDVKPSFTDANDGKAALGRLLKDKRCLVVLDDIWDLAHYNAAFDALGEQCQLLITTRDNSIANRLSAFKYSLAELEKTKALELLQQWTNVDELPDVATDVAQECGYLPLALAMVGAYLRDRPKRWERVLEKLQTADLEKHKINKQLLPGYQYELFRAIQVSVDALDEVGNLGAEEVQERYLDFAVFSEDMAIPETVLETFWQPLGLDEDDTEELLDELVDKSLLRRDEQGRLTLHDLQCDYISKRTEEDLFLRHQRWLDAYKEKCGQGWASCPQDGYFFGQLTRHLKEAGQLDELRQLLFDYDWLRTQLKANGINRLLADYDWLTDDKALNWLQNTLRLSAHVLVSRPDQLTERLWGHLRDNKQSEFQALLDHASEQQRTAWLQPQHVNLPTPNGPLRRTFEGHSSTVNSVVMSVDGTRALSGSSDGTIKLWNLSMGEVIRTLKVCRSRVSSVALSADGTRALLGAGRTVKLWNLTTGEVILTLEGHSSKINSVALNADGTRALSGADDRIVKFWDLTTGEVILTLEGYGSKIMSVALSADGTRALWGSSDKSVQLWDLTTGEVIRILKGRNRFRVMSVALSADGTRALSGSVDRIINLWDLTTGEVIHTFKGHGSRLMSVALSADGTRALSGSADRTVKLWDLATGKAILTLEGHSGSVNSVALSVDGSHALSGASDGTVKLWRLLTKGEASLTLKSHRGHVRSVTLRADNAQVLSGADDATVKLWDLATGKVIHTFEGHSDWSLPVALSSNGIWALLEADDATVKLWDLTTRQPIRTLESHNSWVNSVALSTDGKWALLGANDAIVKLWDLATDRIVRVFEGHSSSINSVMMSTDTTRVLSGSSDATMKLWDIATGDALRTFEGHSSGVNSVVMSADGKWALSGSADRMLKLWDLSTGEVICTLAGHSNGVNSVVMSADGRRALSGSDDKTLKLWDLRVGNCLATFCGDHPFYACDLSAGSRTIVAGDAAGTVHFFSVIEPEIE
ncbi:NB-ARC domain-containing protein [Leptothoe spongobia]|uniref:Uncharacterized protein n=1 Tax=Leptothoe spongobia TAU-MAC 1115 TaxID=1967444 RepID=A0A947GJB1_9CYAN|nr:NB-ARC domain-containing protein [Leptothoe spongobia]MBT9316840.1 hypothetical protein [Leptothoe spongobia TAU-MAC 1115]